MKLLCMPPSFLGEHMKEFFIEVSKWLDPFFLIYFSIIYIFYIVLTIFGGIKTFHRSKELKVDDLTPQLQSNKLPSITFLIPAYNESKQIISVLENVINLNYRHKNIILVNDGSTDNTMQLIKDKYNLVQIPNHFKQELPSKPILAIYKSTIHPELTVIDKENGEKYDAMNAGINACTDSHFICMDADTYVDDSNFEALIRPILESPKIIAIGATVRIINGFNMNYTHISTDQTQNYLTSMQTLEYQRTFLMRQGWDYIGGNFCLSGAFAVFITDAVKKIGGYGPTVANDLEIILRIHHIYRKANVPYEVEYIPDPVAWTEAPNTMEELGHQRLGWHRGTLESIWFHKTMLFNPKYKGFGLLGFPFLLLSEALEPIVEFFAYLYIIIGILAGAINPYYILALLGIIWGFIVIHTLICIWFEEVTFRKYTSTKYIFKLVLFCFIENIGYRQLTLIWRLKGVLSFFKRFPKIQKDSHNVNKTVKEASQKLSKMN